jgi:hypothetical protein
MNKTWPFGGRIDFRTATVETISALFDRARGDLAQLRSADPMTGASAARETLPMRARRVTIVLVSAATPLHVVSMRLGYVTEF